MERFWTLQYLKQHQITELTATVFKTGFGGPPLVRADTLPLVLPVLGGQDLPRGAHVRVRLGEIDEIALDIHGTLLERLDTDAAPDDSAEDGEDEPVAGPIAIAVDLSDSESPAPAA